MPLWSDQIGYPPDLSVIKKIKQQDPGTNGTIVFFPACISRMLGTYIGKKKNIMETFISICDKTGITVIVMENVSGSCCSQIFASKGFKDAFVFTANKIVDLLWKASREGKYPIVTDVSSCAYTLHHLRAVLDEEHKIKFDQVTILDSVDFLYSMVMPVAIVKQKKSNIVLHPVCSLEKMKTVNKFVLLAKHFATGVTVPANAGCCGMAGDRGFLFPELTASATQAEALEVSKEKYNGYYSSTKTCEMAMSEAVKENFESILYLVDEAI